jgi:hypothetical protein
LLRKPLTCVFVEPEEGFEPSTFRLREKRLQSDQTEPDGTALLTLDTASIWTGPDGGDPTCWMIIGMIKAQWQRLDRVRRWLRQLLE